MSHSLYADPDATLGDLREALNAFEELASTARRVFGGAHPMTVATENQLQQSRAALRAREMPLPSYDAPD